VNRRIVPVLQLQREALQWQWQMRHCITKMAELEEVLQLTPEERAGAMAAEQAGLPLSITPYYLGLCDRHDTKCPIRRQVVPSILEHRESPGEWVDPLGEVTHEVAPDLIQRYPDRALLLVNDRCAVYCRFCTRSRWVGQAGGARSLQRLGGAFEYLRVHPEVREVIVSGGDPLALNTERIVELLAELRRIPSVETIRVATRMPVTLPHRITDELVTAMRSFHPIWIMTHFNHGRELTPLAREACQRLVDAGFPVMNQTVLLRGVNDDAVTLSELFRGLVRERVRPYYLLQGDPVRGTGHLRTPLETGRHLMEQLQGRLSGIALPKLIVDTPGGHGKVPYGPDYVVSRAPGVTRFRSPFGIDVDYLDPPEE
jgi:lysine 2,3-aminomutase